MSLVAVNPTALTRPTKMRSPVEVDVDDFAVGMVDISSDEGSLTATDVDVDTLVPSDGETETGSVPPAMPTPCSIRKRVSFGTLDEFSFGVEKGDPGHYELACPLQLGAECLRESSHSIDEYEELRKGERRSSAELRTQNSEERRKIIKNSQKFEKECKKNKRRHKRRVSIGNGQMGRLLQQNHNISNVDLSALIEADDAAEEQPVGVQSERLPEKPRPTLRRQNSIGNGQISRDKRRNRVQDFLKRMSTSSSKRMSTSKK